MSKVAEILQILDDTYGVTKDGFLHQEPWQLLMAIMLSAQSTDKQVDAVLPHLIETFPTLSALASASIEEIEAVIKSIGLYHNKAKNMKKCAGMILEEYGGEVPDTREELMKLAGVGRKTANLYLADQYEIPTITVDTHVNRIACRLGWTDSKDPLKTELALEKVLPEDHWIRINIQLIRHGRAICRARSPKCNECMLEIYCPKKDLSL